MPGFAVLYVLLNHFRVMVYEKKVQDALFFIQDDGKMQPREDLLKSTKKGQDDDGCRCQPGSHHV